MKKEILKIAFPSIIGFLGMILFESIDIFWIGKLNSNAVAAAGAVAFLEWTIYSLMHISCTGCSALVSRYYGSGETEKRYDVIRESTWISIILSIIISIILLLTSSKIFAFMGLNSVTHTYAIDYFTVMIIGFPVTYILFLQGHIFNALGDTKSSTITILISLALNIILDPLLIFGKLGFPALGIQGAAIATISSQFIALLMRMYLLRKKEYMGKLSSLTKFSYIHIKEILSIGLPSAATNATWSIVFPMLTTIITKFGMDPLAGLNIANRIEGLPYFFSLGFSIAVSAMIGQSYGKGNKEEIKEIFKHGISLITMFLIPTSFAFILIPELLINILNSDPDVIAHGAEYLRIVGYFELFLGWELVTEGAFNGLGNSKSYMFISIPLTLARIPLAYTFAITLNYGIQGVWWAISITTLLKGLGVFIQFGTNKRNKQILAT